jgi:ABC-type multidrug transport system ATPase subunit/ABC-type multidrug transport system permease subunit
LLNVLSGRSSYDDGTIRINGEVLTGRSRKKLMSKIAYVKQSDIFFEYLTVRDQLLYTAFLRLPSTSTNQKDNFKMKRINYMENKEKKLKEVEKVINLLRLQKVADSPIMLCSGGEKKRVNIGTELLTDPKVLLLDEPTSGLDSTSAVALMSLLKKLARLERKTVITSIHQPNSAVFRSFDKLFMLAEGQVVYFGNPVESLSYLSNLGFKTPDGYNAADHWMDLLVHDNEVSDEQSMLFSRGFDASTESITDQLGGDVLGLSGSQRSHICLRRRKSSIVDRNRSRGILIDAWANVGENDHDCLLQGLTTQGSENNRNGSGVMDRSPGHSVLDSVTKYNTDWLTQYLILTHRSMKNSRSAIFTPINFIKSFALGLIVGMLFYQTKMTESSIRDISSLYFFTMTNWVYDAMFESFMAFPSERIVILKERASASYRLSAYFLAKTTSEAPTRMILPLVYCGISFWMTGVNNKISVFLGTTGCTLLSVLAGEAIGLLVGAAIYNLERAMTVITIVSLTLMLLGGFFTQSIPSFISWARFLSPFKYAFDASQLMIFDDNIPCDGSGVLYEACRGSEKGYASPAQVLKFLGVEGSMSFHIGMLWVIIIVPRYLAYLALRSKRSGDRE